MESIHNPILTNETKENKMIEVNFCRAPSHYWVGWCTYENGTYYASGNTLDNMLYCIKRTLYTKKRISVRGVILASKQSEQGDAPLQLFKKLFKTKYWYGNNFTPKTEEAKTKDISRPLPEPTGNLEYDYYDTRVENGMLVVYGIARHRVAEYKLNPDSYLPPITVPDTQPKITPFGSPQQPFAEPQIRYDSVIGNSVDDTPKTTAKWKPRPDIPTE